MNKKLKLIFAAVAIPAVIVGGIAMMTESSADIARKPQVIEQVLQDSRTFCAAQDVFQQTKPAEARLREIFAASRTKDLENLLAHKVTVCLDQRLPGQNGGFFTTNAYGTFYNQDPGHPVLAVWDNGEAAQDSSLFHSTPVDYGREAISHLNGGEYNGLFGGKPDSFAMLAYYVRSCGKNCTTSGYEWRNVDGLLSGYGNVLKEHPALATPPVKVPVAAAYTNS